MNTEIISNKIIEFAVAYGPRLLAALAVLVIGSWIIKILTRGIGKIIEKKNPDKSLNSFIKSLVGILLKTMLILSVLTMLGVEMTSFIAILGAAGLAVGLALSGTLQNFAGGVMILIFKPFKVEDVIEAQGYLGVVNEIQIFNTILKTFDNKTVIIPNGGLSTSSLTNYSSESVRRVDFTFGIAYGDSYDKAKEVLLRLINEDKRVLNEPAEPFIALSELADSSVNIVVRVWAKGEDYWGVYFDLNEKVYKVFGEEGLSIPFPQMDVHVHKQN